MKNVECIDNLHRAEEFVKAARLCFENGLYNAAASRAYYGVLHAGVVALVCFAKDQTVRELMSRKTHEKVGARFDEKLAKRSKLFSRHRGVIRKLQIQRLSADYGLRVNKSDARDSVKSAEEFFGDIKGKMTNDKLYC